MSYDISLFRPDFLQRAIETGLGDWTNADPIAPEVIRTVIDDACAEGFELDDGNQTVDVFLRSTDPTRALHLHLDGGTTSARLGIHPGQIAFTIGYGGRDTGASVELCTRLAERLASAHDLALFNPQGGRGHEVDTSVWLEELRSPDPAMRATAATRLGGRDEAAVIAPALAVAAGHDTDLDVRRKALEAIGLLGEAAQHTVDEVMACLADPDPTIQYWATFALGRLGSAAEKALPALEALTNVNAYGPRYGSVDAIARIRDQRSAG